MIRIQQLSLDDKIIKEFVGGAEASRETGISAKAITKCAQGRSKTSHGFKWRYVGGEVDGDN